MNFSTTFSLPPCLCRKITCSAIHVFSIRAQSEDNLMHFNYLTVSKYLSESVGPYHNGQAFSTFDHDVDKYGANCAVKYHGGWWYNSCYYANLNGPYITPGVWTEKAIRYKSFFDYRSLKSCKMMIRRR